MGLLQFLVSALLIVQITQEPKQLEEANIFFCDLKILQILSKNLSILLILLLFNYINFNLITMIF